MKTVFKTRWFTEITTLCLVAVTLFAAGGCEKSKELNEWECALEHFNTTITLTINSKTNLVSVSKSPKEIGDNDAYHQFRDGDQYVLQNDTLYYRDIDGVVDFIDIWNAFAITRLSGDEMKLKYLGAVVGQPIVITSYLFNRKK